jgi:pimeloyl-ACP methyl ester carboxylesterase
MPVDPSSRAHPAAGVARLLVDSIVGATEVVETMHARISPLQPTPRDPMRGRARGITGLVYRSVRGVARLSGRAMGLLFPRGSAAPTIGPSRPAEALLAALKGVAGDQLIRTENPLAIPMRLRRGGRPLELTRAALASSIPAPTGRIVVLVHGLCMNDLQWRRRGHDHGAALAADLGYTPVYLQYNTGLHTSENGRAFAELLEELVSAWPVPVRELAIVGHSMGGLVARSACHYALRSGLRWPGALRSVVCLGTPHQGAPLEVAGQRLHRALRWSSFTAPLVRLAAVRSAGITDLRAGNLLDEDWLGSSRFATSPGARGEADFPAHARSYTIAASVGRRPGDLKDRLFGDQLVRRHSALGVDAEDSWTGYGMGHLDLLSHPEVYARLRGWLGTER